MKVYILMSWEGSDARVLDVYVSREDAVKALHRMKRKTGKIGKKRYLGIIEKTVQGHVTTEVMEDDKYAYVIHDVVVRFHKHLLKADLV